MEKVYEAWTKKEIIEYTNWIREELGYGKLDFTGISLATLRAIGLDSTGKMSKSGRFMLYELGDFITSEECTQKYIQECIESSKRMHARRLKGY